MNIDFENNKDLEFAFVVLFPLIHQSYVNFTSVVDRDSSVLKLRMIIDESLKTIPTPDKESNDKIKNFLNFIFDSYNESFMEFINKNIDESELQNIVSIKIRNKFFGDNK